MSARLLDHRPAHRRVVQGDLVVASLDDAMATVAEILEDQRQLITPKPLIVLSGRIERGMPLKC